MKNIKLLLLFVALMASKSVFAKGDYLLVGGSGWNKIVIFDKESKKLIWDFTLPGGAECNSVTYTKGGHIAFSFSKGASVINQEGNILLEVLAKPGEEIQSISEIKGGFLIGICGNPSRILEVSKYGDIKKDIKYETGVEQAHGQHRQITKAKNGNYLVPVLGKSKVMEINDKGETVREVAVPGVLFSITELPSGNWLIPCGDSGYFVEVNPATGETVKKVDSSMVEGVKFGFVAQTVRLKNGNTYVCNWLGHGGEKSQPILIELNPENKVVWKLDNNTPGIGAISTVCPVSDGYYR